MHYIDAHHHLWAPDSDPDNVGWVWLKEQRIRPFGDPAPIQRDYLLEEFRKEPEPLTMVGSVHVQADPRVPDPVVETRFIQRLSDAAGFPVMIIGFVDLAAADAPAVITGHLDHSGFRGVRQIIARVPDRSDVSFAAVEYLDDPVWLENFGLLGQNGLSFDLQLYPEQMLKAADVLARFPDTQVVLDHLGSPYDLSDAGLRVWRTGLAALSRLPHVHVKLSGYGMYFKSGLTEQATDITREILDLFGPARAMFGSNFPVDKLHLDYDAAMELVLDCIDPADVGRIFHDNAYAFYRFEK